VVSKNGVGEDQQGCLKNSIQSCGRPPEQTKIAGILSAMDGKISAVGEQMRQSQAWKKGLLQQMFV
jgi:type I restriction enzyme S subunit